MIPRFEDLWAELDSNTLLGPIKSQKLYEELLQTLMIPGCMAEVGVYKGQTARLMRRVRPDALLHLYDTFTGIVMADEHDWHTNGEFADTSLEAVQRLVGLHHVGYHQGMFPDTFTEQGHRFSFVHSDTDTYFGTVKTLEVFMPLLSPGGRLVFDDYKSPTCPGVEEALTEWLPTCPFEILTHEWVHQFVIIRLK